jgi:GAF domain
MIKARSQVLRKESEKSQNELVTANVIAFVAFPAIIGLMGAFTSDIYKNHNWLVFALWAIIIVFFALFWWRAYPAPQSLLKLVYENEQMEDKLRELEADVVALEDSIKMLASQAELALSSQSIIITSLDRRISSLDDLKWAIADLCAIFYLEGEFVFGFGGSEFWNFGVYLYSKDSDLLVPVWREKSRNHPSQGPGRSWERGQGHIGKCFADAQVIITGDALHPDVRQLWWAPTGSEKPYDGEAYRSFASIPIGPIREEEKRPYGVLVATSNRLGRFDRENAVILQLVAGAIGSILALSGATYDSLNGNSA